MTLLDGKKLSSAILEKLRINAMEVNTRRGYPPHLCAILVGEDPASHTYVNAKQRACHDIGCAFTIKKYDDIEEAKLLDLIQEINADDSIDGLIVQLPLSPKISSQKVIDSILPRKDVDGFHSLNYGRMARGLPAHVPATPLGILKIFEHYKIETAGKHCVIVGRGNTVGAPLSILMGLNAPTGNATVTVCHKLTKDIKSLTLQADIVVAAVGRPFLITEDMVRPGIVIVDVGINRIADPSQKRGYRIEGDVDFKKIAPHAAYITPVPGGVGPMTIASLLSNTIDAAQGRIF